ncbi:MULTISPECIES: hypothetical protein [Paenibacillus]|uniref:hypothetical protein n=1 Tax=Paenibacillus TaxID=44249 RepID=UPI000839226D|nr:MULTISPECIES: hypothetical protein [Paenibacillus]GIP23248.1 hypothetical protein J22TS3_35230 [Paenibacillus sp. J22TS3]
MNKKLMFAAAAAGAAYLMRNPESRQKLMNQVQNFTKSGSGGLGKYLNQMGIGKNSSSSTAAQTQISQK